MDRVAFVKTLEAILAAIIAVSVYTFIQAQSINQVQEVNRLPEKELNDFLKVIDLNSIIKEDDYLLLDYYFNYLNFKTINYYFEPIYYEELGLSSDFTISWPNLSFIYHFPRGIDENSVRVIKGDYELSAKADFNWYYIPVLFNEPLINEYVVINLSVSEDYINNDSFLFFLNNHESITSLNDYSIDEGEVNVSLICFVPEVNTSDYGYIYYSTSNYTNISYPSLSVTSEANYTTFNVQKARTADVIFSPENVTINSSNYYLKYSLFSSEPERYASFAIVNNSNVTISINNNLLREGTTPYTPTFKGEGLVKKIIPVTNGLIELNVYGDYS